MLTWYNSQEVIPGWAISRAMALQATQEREGGEKRMEKKFHVLYQAIVLGFLLTIALAWAGGF